MKRIVTAGLTLALLAGAAWLRAQEPPEASAASAEQAFLQQLAGEWETEGKVTLDPAQPPISSKGTESARMLGDLWLVSEIETTYMDVPFSAVSTLGYDPETEMFVGTWVDSMSSHLWHYEGTLDADGKTLTLEAEGPSVRTPGEHARFRDVVVIQSRNEKTFTSRVLIDGEWETFLTVHSRRKR